MNTLELVDPELLPLLALFPRGSLHALIWPKRD